MCGRFNLRTPPAKVFRDLQLQLPGLEDWQPRYNIAPTRDVPAARAARDGGYELALLHWGLIPSWAKDPRQGARMINARCETAASKPAFRAAFRRRRCLIPADGFYEWKKEGRAKQPYNVVLQDGPMAMAGLWERWGEGETAIQSCTILTTDANELLAPLHDRMPVILPPADWKAWLDPASDDVDALEELLVPYPADAMRAYPVSTDVNKVGNDNPQCIEPLPQQGTLPGF